MHAPIFDWKRKINGTTYYYDNGFPTKHASEKYVKSLRERKYLVRVIYDKIDGWYNVFVYHPPGVFVPLALETLQEKRRK